MWLSLQARYFGTRPSEMIIPDAHEVTRLDLDSACTLRLMRYDNERERDRREWLADLLSRMITGKGIDRTEPEHEQRRRPPQVSPKDKIVVW